MKWTPVKGILFGFLNPFISTFFLFFSFTQPIQCFSVYLEITRGTMQLLSSTREEHGAQPVGLFSDVNSWYLLSIGEGQWHWDIWTTCRIISMDWAFWKPLSSWGHTHTPHRDKVPVFQTIQMHTCILAHLTMALHTLSTADLTELFLHCRTAQLTHVCSCCSYRPQRRAKDTYPKGAEMKSASLLRNLIFTLQLRVESSIFKAFLSGVSS